jgi:hypothetical protein
MADRPGVDTANLYNDDVLEKELRDALKSEPEIELFKLINKSLRVRAELADTEIIRVMLGKMWGTVADFFEVVTEAPTLAALPHDDPLVLAHQRMKANFEVVSEINNLFKQAGEAEVDLKAIDQMEHETEEPQ